MGLEEIRRKIRDLAEPVAERHGAFFVECQIRNERGAKVIQVFIDTDAGITIDQCAEISRDLSAVLETQRLFEGMFHLEVSSPGLERPLRLLRQYPKNIGRKFRVRYVNEAEPRTVSATLMAVVEDQLTFQPEKGEPFSVPFDRIIESKEELPW